MSRATRLQTCHTRSGSAAGLDSRFDRLVPSELRYLSAMHWTPASVAVRAASLLGATADTRVLDVGSGIGKVCTIGALSSLGTWIGVEQHGLLASAATNLAHTFGVANRTRFFESDAFAIDWNEFDALYFYNPFELALGTGTRLDSTHQIARVQERLAGLPEGTRVVTFHGFGGVMPPTFELLHHERMPEGLDLVLWRQRGSGVVS